MKEKGMMNDLGTEHNNMKTRVRTDPINEESKPRDSISGPDIP